MTATEVCNLFATISNNLIARARHKLRHFLVRKVCSKNSLLAKDIPRAQILAYELLIIFIDDIINKTKLFMKYRAFLSFTLRMQTFPWQPHFTAMFYKSFSVCVCFTSSGKTLSNKPSVS